MNNDQLVSVVHLLLKQNEEKKKRNEEIMGKLNSIYDKHDKADARHDEDAKRTSDLIEIIMELNVTVKITLGSKSQKRRRK